MECWEQKPARSEETGEEEVAIVTVDNPWGYVAVKRRGGIV